MFSRITLIQLPFSVYSQLNIFSLEQYSIKYLKKKAVKGAFYLFFIHFTVNSELNKVYYFYPPNFMRLHTVNLKIQRKQNFTKLFKLKGDRQYIF